MVHSGRFHLSLTSTFWCSFNVERDGNINNRQAMLTHIQFFSVCACVCACANQRRSTRPRERARTLPKGWWWCNILLCASNGTAAALFGECDGWVQPVWPESKAITCCHCCRPIGEMVWLINQKRNALRSWRRTTEKCTFCTQVLGDKALQTRTTTVQSQRT